MRPAGDFFFIQLSNTRMGKQNFMEKLVMENLMIF